MRAVALVAIGTLILGFAAGRARGDNDPCPLSINKVTLAGSVRVLACYETSTGEAVLSRDHRLLFYAPRNLDYPSREVWVAHVDGSSNRRLLQAAGGITQLALSPDGRTIALATIAIPYQGGADGLWLVNSDATNLRGIGGPAGGLTWAPDSKRLAFYRRGRLVVATMNNDTTTFRDIAAATPGARPSWSADGSALAFDSSGRIRIAPSSGRRSRVLVKGRVPRWSAGSGRVAFLRLKGGVYSIWVVPSRGGRAQIAVRRTAPDENDPYIWSPLGKRLASTWYDGTNRRMQLVVTTFGTRFRSRVVSKHQDRSIGPISWSRDGRSLVYVAQLFD
jgi:Tol biopolymer transport system component